MNQQSSLPTGPDGKPGVTAPEVGAPVGDPTAGVPDTGVTDTGTALRSFNRFELKYVVDRSKAAEFKEELIDRMLPDPHQPGDAYRVRSVYFDTRDLQFYWEKIDGLRFRRKLRIRHYGHPHEATPATPVFVEIKQRVNRVTQKRRASMSLAQARDLCLRHVQPEGLPVEDQPFLSEATTLAETLDLQSTALIMYWRDALIGNDTEPGLRVTFDTDLQVRGNDLDLADDSPSRVALEPDLVIIEVKVNERVPYWLTQTVARHQLTMVRVSKYCQGIEVMDRAPRSAFHIQQLNSIQPDPIQDDLTQDSGS